MTYKDAWQEGRISGDVLTKYLSLEKVKPISTFSARSSSFCEQHKHHIWTYETRMSETKSRATLHVACQNSNKSDGRMPSRSAALKTGLGAHQLAQPFSYSVPSRADLPLTLPSRPCPWIAVRAAHACPADAAPRTYAGMHGYTHKQGEGTTSSVDFFSVDEQGLDNAPLRPREPLMKQRAASVWIV